jgi:predicted lipoprotein with Yx(FWY)xxD motif
MSTISKFTKAQEVFDGLVDTYAAKHGVGKAMATDAVLQTQEGMDLYENVEEAREAVDPEELHQLAKAEARAAEVEKFSRVSYTFETKITEMAVAKRRDGETVAQAVDRVMQTPEGMELYSAADRARVRESRAA